MSAFHSRERELSKGTILTPDGDHYIVQFDRQKQGVHTIKDFFVKAHVDHTSSAASAPEADASSGGLGHAFCASVKEHAGLDAAATLSHLLSTRRGCPTPSKETRELLSAGASLMAQMHNWASAPVSPVESRLALLAALKRLSPKDAANSELYVEVVHMTQLLQSIVSGEHEPCS